MMDDWWFEEDNDEIENGAATKRGIGSIDLDMSWDGLDIEEDEEVIAEKLENESAAGDALIMSLQNKGYVCIPYMLRISRLTMSELLEGLGDCVYQNPGTWGGAVDEGWETADEYLSGNLRVKLEAAREASAKLPGRFHRNVRALERIMPKPAAASEIYVTLGSPWIPGSIIEEFALDIMGVGCSVKHDEITGTWEVTRRFSSWRAKISFATKRMKAVDLLRRTLNMQTVAVYDEVKCETTKSGKRRQLNERETTLASDMQRKLQEAFAKWVWDNKIRRERLEKIYNDRYCGIKRRIYDGSFLTFPGMNPDIALMPYQRDAAARIIFSPNTLLAHDVGAGKTYVMIAAGMEMRRINRSKNLYVVPNNVVGQWAEMYAVLYPKAKVLTVEPKDFTPSKRQAKLMEIRDGSFDGVIIAYSCFEQIPLSEKYRISELREEAARIADAKSIRKTKASERRAEQIHDKLMELEIEERKEEKYTGICFDDLGINMLFVDEAHNFKNVPMSTHIDRVLGLNPRGSKKCQEMMDKVHYVQKMNNGRGVVFATGTPITNSVTDVFVMQKYLQEGELAMVDLQNFDSWVGMFAERSTEFEIDVDTSSYRLTTRLARFHNLPELTALLGNIADFHQVDISAGIPDFDGYEDVLIRRSSAFTDYLKEITMRAERVRKHRVKRTEDNMLKITTDGRKAALDVRLVGGELWASDDAKVFRCAEKIYRHYIAGAADRLTQLVFCDTSTPKAGFNIYDALKSILTSLGIPAEEIAYIHDYETEKKRSALFMAVREGQVRVLIGSTFKLGLGVNVQDRLIALHHLDIPWRPADMVQREGRILRQGNTNSRVFIYRYITEGSFDAYSWQLLETKQRFISELLAGSITGRDGTNVDDTVLSYAEVKALAVGNPLVKKRVELANELSHLSLLQRKMVETRLMQEQEVIVLDRRMQEQAELVRLCEEDAKYLEQEKAAEEHAAEDKAAQEKSPDRKHAAVMEEEKRLRRQQLYEAIMNDDALEHDIEVMEYRGFRLVVPADNTAKRKDIILVRAGHYRIEAGTSEVGQFVRIDNFINHFEDKLAKLREGYKSMAEHREELMKALAAEENHTERIEELKCEIARIDEELGVDWNENREGA